MKRLVQWKLKESECRDESDRQWRDHVAELDDKEAEAVLREWNLGRFFFYRLKPQEPTQ